MCRICHACRFIKMYATNKQQSRDACAEVTARTTTRSLGTCRCRNSRHPGRRNVFTENPCTHSRQLESGNQPRKEIPGRKQPTFQASGVCRVAVCKMFSSGRKLCRVSGLAQASKIRVSTFEGLSSCPKEHTFFTEQPCRVSGLAQTGVRHRSSRATVPQKTSPEFWKGLETALKGSSESQDSRNDKVTHRRPERGFRTSNLLRAPSIAVTKCTRSDLPSCVRYKIWR